MFLGRHLSRFHLLVLTATFLTLLLIAHFKIGYKTIYSRFDKILPLKELWNCGGRYSNLRTINNPFRAIVVDANGDILTRICLFNTAIQRLRELELELETFADVNLISINKWTGNPPGRIQVLYEWSDNFTEALTNYSQFKNVILPWKQQVPNEEWSSLSDSTNLLIQDYYLSTASDVLCTWIETPGKVNYAFDMINNWTCNRDITRTLVPVSVSYLALNVKATYKDYYFPSAFPDYFHTQPPFSVFHLHIIKFGIITKVGDVFSGNVKIVPYGCFPIKALNPPKNVKNIPFRKEILVIAQNHGDEMYHRISEVMPRIALFIDFLQSNPSIAIFSLENKGLFVELLGILGIDRERIVTREYRAGLVYLPRTSACCLPNFIENQVLSKRFRDYIRRNFAMNPRDKIVVIRRSHYRRFRDQEAVERVVENVARTFNLSFSVYQDNPSPSLNDTMIMFNSAVVVIGPHGAGLANVVFSEPGTFVIEGVCNLPHANLFFQRTCLVLGHRWHGIPATEGCVGGVFGVVGVSPLDINSTLFAYLQLMLHY